MQLLVDRSELLRAVAHASGAVASKNAIPILSHVVLTAYAEKGTVRGTDLDIEIEAPFAAQAVTEQGRCCVPARLFHDIIKRMPESKPISLTLIGDKLRIVCGKSTKIELAALPPDDHPAFAAAPHKESWRFEIDAAQLRGLLAAVRHAVSKDETRFYLQGVYLHVTGDEPVHLKAVATNGYILALQACLAPTGAYAMPGIIVPGDTVAQMLKLLPDEEQLVEMIVSNSFVWLHFPDGLSLGSKLIQGTYPEYWNVIPSGNPNRVSCDADALAVVVDRVATVCTGEKAREVVMLMNPRGPLTLSATSAATGTAKDNLDAAEKATKKAAIGFNHRYMLQLLAAYSGGTVEISYAGADAPLLLKLAGDTSETSLQVLMPMRHSMTEEELEKEAA
jgi:DNA polymerase III subunit beta